MPASPFAEVPLAPADPILGLTEAFVADKNPAKVNLGVGVYQDGTGKVPVLALVRERRLQELHPDRRRARLPQRGTRAAAGPGLGADRGGARGDGAGAGRHG